MIKSTIKIVLGRIVGKSQSFERGCRLFILHGFEPDPRYKGPVGESVAFDFESGRVETYNDDWTLRESKDMMDSLRDCWRAN